MEFFPMPDKISRAPQPTQDGSRSLPVHYDSDVRLIWRQQFRERVAQFQLVKRLLQHRKTLVAVWQAVLVIAGRKDEGYAARGERVGYGVAHLPVEIDIEHRGVDGLRVEHRQSLIDAGGGAADRAA